MAFSSAPSWQWQGIPIPSDVVQQSLEEAEKCDLMLICGTSAAVYPFALLPTASKQSQRGGETVLIEINTEPTPLTER